MTYVRYLMFFLAGFFLLKGDWGLSALFLSIGNTIILHWFVGWRE